MKHRRYELVLPSFQKEMTYAMISDLHGCDPREAVALLKQIHPDVILAPGDIFEPLTKNGDERNEAGFELLSRASRIAPTFFSLGNHENGGINSWNVFKDFSRMSGEMTKENRERLLGTGVILLDNGAVELDGILYGGLTSSLIRKNRTPDLDFLKEFSERKMPKVLLCHHPEYYKKHFAELDIDLTVSGHAHGGQWRFFGRGVFAPGQGLFPKYTRGVYDGRLMVGTGLKHGWIIPRIFNPPELVEIHVVPEKKADA